MCSPVLSLQVPSVRGDFSCHSDTNVCHRHCVWHHSRSKGGPLSPFLYVTHEICNHDQIPEQLKVPVKSQPAKPAAKRAGNRAAQPTSQVPPPWGGDGHNIGGEITRGAQGTLFTALFWVHGEATHGLVIAIPIPSCIPAGPFMPISIYISISAK